MKKKGKIAHPSVKKYDCNHWNATHAKTGKRFLRRVPGKIFDLKKYRLNEDINLKNDVCSRHSLIFIVMDRHASIIFGGQRPKILKKGMDVTG